LSPLSLRGLGSLLSKSGLCLLGEFLERMFAFRGGGRFFDILPRGLLLLGRGHLAIPLRVNILTCDETLPRRFLK
jgi:hypothetical protein